jgi:hypothetical protein
LRQEILSLVFRPGKRLVHGANGFTVDLAHLAGLALGRAEVGWPEHHAILCVAMAADRAGCGPPELPTRRSLSWLKTAKSSYPAYR